MGCSLLKSIFFMYCVKKNRLIVRPDPDVTLIQARN